MPPLHSGGNPWAAPDGFPSVQSVYGRKAHPGNRHPASVLQMNLRLYDTMTRQKRVFLVEDSIVRSTTMKVLVERIRKLLDEVGRERGRLR